MLMNNRLHLLKKIKPKTKYSVLIAEDDDEIRNYLKTNSQLIQSRRNNQRQRSLKIS